MLQSRRKLNGMERSRFVAKRAEPGSIKDLTELLDEEIRRIIRSLYRWCISCGIRQHLEVSHFFSRRFLRIRWDLRNVAAQCHGCNQLHNHNPAPYELWMIRTYGQAVIDELDALRRSMVKVTTEELRELLAELKGM